MKSLKTVMTIALLIVSTFLVPTSLVFSKADVTTSGPMTGELPSRSIHVELKLSSAPALGAEAQLTCSVKSELDAPKTEVEVKLPDGFAMSSGDTSWFGDIPAGGAIEIKSVIKAVLIGDWTIQAKAKCTGFSLHTAIDELHVFVRKDSTTVGVSPDPPICARVDNPPDVALLPEQEIAPKAMQPTEPSNPEISATLTVTGRFWCYISQDSISGHTSDIQLPMCWGNVWIYNTLGTYLTGGITDLNGYFSLPISNPYPFGFYVVMTPYTTGCHVVKPDGSEYAGYTINFFPTSSQTTYDIGGWMPPALWDYTGAWRIYESIVADYYDRGAWDFMANEGPGLVMPAVIVKFKTSSGTYIDLNAGTIYIDTEAYSKALDIAQHEYGHWVMWTAYNHYWPPNAGGTHYINRISNPNMAWTEGFADAFPLICQSYGRWEDWYFEWGEGTQYDLETCPNCDNGASCEGRVAGTLWDIFDSHNDGYDTFQDGFTHTWYIVYHGIQNTYLDFHNQWRSYGFDRHLLNFCEYQNTIDYDTSPDLTNGSVSPTTGDTSTTFTFTVRYQDADWDPAATIRVYVYDGIWNYYTMNHVSGDPASGEWFNKQLSGFSAGDHDFYFTASDGLPGGDARYPSTGYLSFHITQITYTLTIQVSGSGTTNPAVGTYTYNAGTNVQVNAYPSSGWILNHWELDGSNVGSANPYTVTMNSNHVLKAVFTQIVTYDVTIVAHCNTEGVDLGVAITMDGSPTGFNTPHTFSVTGTHTFGVPAADASSHPFSQWNIGEATATITVTSARTYTAYYGPSFTIWTEGYKTTYHIGETMRVYVRVRNPGPALPVRAEIFLKLPSNALYGPLLDMKVTLPANYDSGKVLWQTFTIPTVPLGNYAWIAELRNPSTNALISQSTWSWQLSAATSMQIPTANVILQEKPE